MGTQCIPTLHTHWVALGKLILQSLNLLLRRILISKSGFFVSIEVYLKNQYSCFLR